MAAYYNEIDPFCAEWLRNLIRAELIAPGDVDTRSIVDVRPDDLKSYTQCHFFAGIAGWGHALRLAGFPDDRPVWTGSCPCQPFSVAGKGKAADDERHLAPAWLSLIAECRPPVIFGEQVEAAVGWGWLDFVFDALEAEGYACGQAVFPACGVGAPHIRQRLYFVADAERDSRGTRRLAGESAEGVGTSRAGSHDEPGRRSVPDFLADSKGHWRPVAEHDEKKRRGKKRHRTAPGFWNGCEWLPCRDGKARPVKPGIQPLAHGIPARVGKLRAAGNAIVPQQAEAFIRAWAEV